MFADLILDRTRKLADNCTDSQDFTVHRAVVGGTSSGLGWLMLERLPMNSGKNNYVEFRRFGHARKSPRPLLNPTTRFCECIRR